MPSLNLDLQLALLCVLFCNSIQFTFGQTKQSPFAKVASLRSADGYKYEGRECTLEELLRNNSFVLELRDLHLSQSDPHGFLSPDEHKELSKHGVSFSNSCQKSGVTFDAIGFSVTDSVFEGREILWKGLVGSFRNKHLGKTLTTEIVPELIELRRSASDIWQKGKKRNTEEQIYVKARLSQHFSKVRKRQEFWFVVEIGTTGTKFEEFFLNELYDVLNSAPVAGVPLRKLPHVIQPHPESEETLFEVNSVARLEPNRGEGPRVHVVNDGLSAAEREQAYGFSLSLPSNVNEMQIESHAFSGTESIFEQAFTEILLQRIPASSVETPESLHLKIGSACRAYRTQFGQTHHIKFAISDAGFKTKSVKYYRIDAQAE